MENYLYFYIHYIIYDKEEKDSDFIFLKYHNKKPECILSSEIKEGKYYKYNKIFKISKLAKNKYYFELEINKNKYIISFDNKKDKTFIFEVNLEVEKKIISIARKINSNNLTYAEILDYFEQALQQNKENDKINELYKDTLESLFSNKKSFFLLIALFIKIYQKKDLCILLLNKFRQINISQRENYEYMDRIIVLNKYVSKILEIESEAEQLIVKNNYDIIEYYGVILSYLNYYDYKNFLLIVDKLYNEKPEALYGILLIYFSNFSNPINQKMDFLEKFLNYTIMNKEFSIFKIALDHIEDLEIFVCLIEKYKEKYVERYKSDNSKNQYVYIIEVNEKRKLKKLKDSDDEKNIENENKQTFKIIQYIESINNYSLQNNTFFVYFSNNFWKYLLHFYYEPKIYNIRFCFKLREAFIKYYKLVITIFDKKKLSIKTNATKYFEVDEFTIILNRIIMEFIQNNKSLSDIEKLKLIFEYNPYYIEDKYSNFVNISILDFLDFNNIDDFFIEYYRGKNFEIIFKYDINGYISKIMSKIKTISDFDIIKLINFENFDNKDIILKYLNDKFDNIIIKEIDSLTGTKLKKALKVIAKLAIIHFYYEKKENKFDFIENKINKLSKKLVDLIYTEILKDKAEEKNENFENLRIYFYKKFMDEFNDIEKISNMIDSFEENKKIEFLKELLQKISFTKEEFFLSDKNIKILLLINLYEKGTINNNNIKYFESTIELLENVYRDIEGNITKKTLDEFLLNENSVIIRKLEIIKLINEDFNPNVEFELLKNKNIEINNGIKKLQYIRDNIIIYHKNGYEDIIKKLENIFKAYSKLNIEENIRKLNELMKECEKLEMLVDKINKVKNFLLFRVIFEMGTKINEVSNFNYACDKLEEIGRQLKENKDINQLYESNKEIINKIIYNLNDNKERIQKFINDMIKYYNISDKIIIDKLTLFFNLHEVLE